MTDLNILPYWKERLDNEIYSKASSESLDREDNFNYAEDTTIYWQPVAKSEKK